MLAQKLENEEMEKQIVDMQRISDTVIVTEETILPSNIPNSNEIVDDEAAVTQVSRLFCNIKDKQN